MIRCATLILAGLACFITTAPAHAAERPNVLLIIGDDQAWGDFGFMGHPHIQTPHIDKLASQSLTFTRGYVPTSLCRPSLMTMTSGLYPHEHKVTGNDPAGRARGRNKRQDPEYLQDVSRLNSLVKDLPTLPRLLADAGYLSYQTGKWWEGSPEDAGFTHGMSHGDPSKGGRHGDAGLKIGRDGLEPIYEFIGEARKQNKPFFVWYAPFLPHTPHNPPQRLLDKYKSKTDSLPMAKYWAMCEWLDETCGELMAHLDKQGLAENTIVLYVTDNGWIQQPDGNGFAPGSKQSPYEGGIRTPIMVRWPGKVKPRRDEQHVVSSVDLAPTVLAACGVAKPAAMSGISLLDEKAVNGSHDAFGAIFTHDVQDLNNPVESLRFRWVVDGEYKLILPYGGGNTGAGIGLRPELYHITKDPHERENLANNQPQKVEQLSARLNDWWRIGG